MKRFLPLLIVFLLTTQSCFADIIIGDPGQFSVNIQIFAPTGQSFIADRSIIKSVGMWISDCNCSPTITMQLALLRGSGTSGSVVAVRTEPAPKGLYGFMNFDFSGVALTVGQSYTAVMTEIAPNPDPGLGVGIYGTPNNYPGGIAFIKGLPRPDLQFSLRVIDDPLAAGAEQYSAKFMCGSPDKDQAKRGEGAAAYGMYFTAVNIHNTTEAEAVFKMKVATSGTGGKSGNGVSSFRYVRLAADQAYGVDCDDIRSLANKPTGFLDGFLVIESDFILDVDAVYTGAQNDQLQTFAIEHVHGRKLNSVQP